MTSTRYILRRNRDILQSVESFCQYYKKINEYIERGAIFASVDRGAFVRPQDLLPEHVISLLGASRSSLSYAYGPEAGPYEIRELIAEKENVKYGTTYGLSNVAIVPGAWSGVELAIENILDLDKGVCSKSTIVVIGPTHYQLFHRAINFYGADIIGFDFVSGGVHAPTSMAEIEDIWAYRPKAIFLTNPNNPDSIYLRPDILWQIIQTAAKNACWVIIDEIQDYFPESPSIGLDYGPWIESDNVIRIDSYSKKRALAEYRHGWVIAPKSFLGDRTSGLIGRLNGLMGNAPRAANSAISYLLRKERDVSLGQTDILEESWKELTKKRRFVQERLHQINNIDVLPTHSGINLLFQIDKDITDFDFSKGLMDKGTLLMPCRGYGYSGKLPIMRFTFAERWEKLEYALDCIEQAANEG